MENMYNKTNFKDSCFRKARLFGNPAFIVMVFITLLTFLFISCKNPDDSFNDVPTPQIPPKETEKENDDYHYQLPTEAEYQKANLYRTNKPDQLMENIPADIEAYRNNAQEFFNRLGNYIVQNSINDFDKVKKVHDWIALNISYDVDSFYHGNKKDQSPDNVLLTGLAVCAGYANIFKSLCDAVNVESKYVHGYARGAGYSLFNNETINRNHAWNIVLIEGAWFLVDSTWNAGYVNGTDFIKRYSTEYLFKRASEFIYNHFPDNPAHQFLEKPVSKEAFLNLPTYKERFFISIKDVNPVLNKINRFNKQFEIKFTVHENVDMLFHVYDENISNTVPNVISVTKEGQVYRSNFNFLDKGKYVLRLFSRLPSEAEGTYFWHCVDFGLIIE
jgi:transglutaminase/protease-like cytokinesis protein 3